MKETTDFVNAKTGEILGSIDTFLDVLTDPTETNLAIKIATRLVGFGCAPENYNKPIIVMATRDFEDGKTIRVTATFEQLLDGYVEDKEEESEEEEEENEEEEEENEEEEEGNEEND